MTLSEISNFRSLLPSRSKPGPKKKPRFLAVDFFCGAGGATRGLIDAGGYVLAGIDNQTSCERTFVSNNGNEALDRDYPVFLGYDVFPKSKLNRSGQQKEIFDALNKLIPAAKQKAGEIPLLFSICAPCQPFTSLSKAGMSQEREQERLRDRSLLAQSCKFVEKYRPELVLSENVSTISSRRFGGVWEDFRRRLEALGYLTATNIVCASKFGIPQYRKRSILLAFRANQKTEIAPALEVLEKDDTAKDVSVFDALSDLPSMGPGEKHSSIPNHVTRNLSELNRKRIKYAIPGSSNAYLENTPEGDLSLECHRRLNRRLNDRCFNDVYTRMCPDRPSPTITTRCHSITNGRFWAF